MSPDDLRDLALRAGRELEGAPARDVLAWAVETFGRRFAIASSMETGVLAHLVSTVAPGVDVLFLDTGYHFAETIGTRDAVAAVYDVTVRTISAGLPDDRLYERDTDLCCKLRKVDPLDAALGDYDAWASGVRRDESPTRADTPVVGWDAKRGKVKVSPLAAWTQAEFDAYVAEHGILVNPLLLDGYPSIGCAPCTQRVAPGADPRSGRWAGTGKTECGLHV
ncbi:MAG TPA: phosphoadenylyl-sulfate reductase [Mycobacteriales bacterium]|jgi:phosphoadenosine phosphosulfate reductase|nr:phosphoadenylyl-sulfate reductase [Mycobacteriales bacterium]